jgi:hypothetical protein
MRSEWPRKARLIAYCWFRSSAFGSTHREAWDFALTNWRRFLSQAAEQHDEDAPCIVPGAGWSVLEGKRIHAGNADAGLLLS